MNMFGRVCPEDLTLKNKKYALRAITLIKEKQSGKIKGRECADGRSQRSYITKEKSAEPTVSMEALLAQLIIDAFEEHAYLNSDIP